MRYTVVLPSFTRQMPRYCLKLGRDYFCMLGNSLSCYNPPMQRHTVSATSLKPHVNESNTKYYNLERTSWGNENFQLHEQCPLYYIILCYYIILLSRKALLHGPSKVLQISTSKWAIVHSHLNNSWISLLIKEKHCYERTHSACPPIETRLNYTMVSGARGHDLSRGLSNSCSSTLLRKVTQQLFILREPTREICPPPQVSWTVRFSTLYALTYCMYWVIFP